MIILRTTTHLSCDKFSFYVEENEKGATFVTTNEERQRQDIKKSEIHR